ncbi:hypothetical protein BB560_001830 [Smittium megazygosporum]|uniref:Uncharacterized protein n=1 Tax=Smittium megazygosporum TaxID=133381 RepID=A0A2T9ZGH1_9FUNG|nr:hypothetical protein BB560_001830 [Smittium megazygosporum]
MYTKSSRSLFRKSSFDSESSVNSESTKDTKSDPHTKEILEETPDKTASLKMENSEYIRLTMTSFVKNVISALKNNNDSVSSNSTVSDKSSVYEAIKSSKNKYKRLIPGYRSTCPLEFGGFVPPLVPKTNATRI